MTRAQRTKARNGLTDDQLELLNQAVACQRRVRRADGTREEARLARDNFVRRALAAGVSKALLATELEMTSAMIWKIEHPAL